MISKQALRAGSWLFLGVLATAVACGGDTAPGNDVGTASQAVTGAPLAASPIAESAGARAVVDGARTTCSPLPGALGDAGIADAALDGTTPASGVSASDAGAAVPVGDSLPGPSLVDHFEARGSLIVPVWKTDLPVGANHLTRVILPARSSAAFQLVDVDTSMQLQVSLQHAHDVPAEVGNGDVVYRGAEASGADVIHNVRREGTEDYLSFKTAPPTLDVAYDVELDSHVAGLRLVSNSLEFLDSMGMPRLRVAPPYLVGADCNRVEADLSVDGCAFDSNPAAPWNRPLTSPGASHCQVHVKWKDEVVYPAILDPYWGSTSTMVAARYNHTTTLLPSGVVLVSGGLAGTGSVTLASSELYTPPVQNADLSWTGGIWATTGALPWPLSSSAAALLQDGRVLVVGGADSTGIASSHTAVYDATGGTWTSKQVTNTARYQSTATLLGNGNVLLAGGASKVSGATYYASSEEYNVSGNTWTTMGSMTRARSMLTATRIGSAVLAVGGYNSTNGALADVDSYSGGVWALTSAHALTSPRYAHTATVLQSGKLLVVGGVGSGGTARTNGEVFDPAAPLNAWASGGQLNSGRYAHGAALLGDGTVLISGGTTDGVTSLLTGERYTPGQTGLYDNSASLSLAGARRAHSSVTLGSGLVLAAGGYGPSGAVSSSELLHLCVGTELTDNNVCTADVCNEHTGIVTHTPLPGASCGVAATACTAAYTCDAAGVCQHAAPQPTTTICIAATSCAGAAYCNGTDIPATACPATAPPFPIYTPCPNATVCDGTEMCDGAGVCNVAGTSLPTPSDACTVTTCDPVLGVQTTATAGAPGYCSASNAANFDGGVPSPTVPTNPATEWSFLYTGTGAPQQGVTTAIIPMQAAVIRGRVLDGSGFGISSIPIRLLGQSGYGSTLTRTDGRFDLAVNGGGQFVVEYGWAGSGGGSYLPLQRNAQTRWGEYTVLNDVVMQQIDTSNAATQNINFGTAATGFQVVRGTLQNDSPHPDGARQATVIFPPGVYTDDPLLNTGTQAFHATEYTVGPNGPHAMPADLPPTSAYTYAVDLTFGPVPRSTVNFIDRAPGVGGAVPVQVSFYLDNFMQMPQTVDERAEPRRNERAGWAA